MKTPVYLDHSATTPISNEVLEEMLPYFSQQYGNPSAVYSLGLASREAVDLARERVAAALNASPEEICFTSGGTESDNMALHGVVEAYGSASPRILTTPIEHHAILETAEALKRRGAMVDFLTVDCEGRVDPDDVGRAIDAETCLVSVMHANNEIGTIEPIAEIGAVCRSQGVLFHTDAVQSFGVLPIDVRADKIDLLSLSGHKLYGPKGIGALYVRRGLKITRRQSGGAQERGLRGGTLNVPGIVGLGKAAEIAANKLSAERARQIALRDRFIGEALVRLDGVRVSGSRTHRLPGNIHLCISGIDAEPLLLALDMAGIYASAGSACSAGATGPSHVLTAIGVPRDGARGALRLTMGRLTDWSQLEYALEALETAVRDLRKLR